MAGSAITSPVTPVGDTWRVLTQYQTYGGLVRPLLIKRESISKCPFFAQSPTSVPPQRQSLQGHPALVALMMLQGPPLGPRLLHGQLRLCGSCWCLCLGGLLNGGPRCHSLGVACSLCTPLDAGTNGFLDKRVIPRWHSIHTRTPSRVPAGWPGVPWDRGQRLPHTEKPRPSEQVGPHAWSLAG